MADLAFAPQHNMIAYQRRLKNSATSQTINDEKQIHAIAAGKTVVITESSVRRHLLFTDANGIICYIFGSREDRMEHDIELTDLLPQTSHDSPLLGGRTPGSDEGSMTLMKLTNLCTPLLQKILDLENPKTTQAKKIVNLKKRITKLEQRQCSRFLGFYPFRVGASKRNSLGRRKVSKQERKNLNTVETVNFARPHISTARPKVSIAELKTPPTTTNLFEDEDVTIVDTFVKMKNQKAKKGIAFKDADNSARPIRSITILQPLPTIDPQDKGKGILQEFEPIKKTKKKDQDQIKRDDEVASKIQAHLNEEARIKRETQEEASKAALA
uniref:Uncharacterized protein n=1 Tax=Tanacetum cinerariifolium TaxID=118510 RepID=A0A699GYR9_TANCI|nr:hypothetical protein [Tanacetum cinerariifolium]